MATTVFGVDSPTTSSSGALTNTCAHNKATGYVNATLPVVHLVADGEILTLVEAIGRATTSGVEGTGYFGLYITDETGTVDGALVTSLIPITTSSPTVTWYSSAALSFDLSPWAGQYIKLAVGPDSGWRRGQVTGSAGDTAVIGTSFPDPFGTGTTQSTFYPIKASVFIADAQSITSVNGGTGITPGVVGSAVLSGFTETPDAATFGGMAVTGVSYSAPNLSFTAPDYIDGEVYPDLVGSYDFVVTTSGTQTATLSVALNLKTGWSQVALASAVTGDDTYFSDVLNTDGVSIADGTRLTWPTTTGFSYGADGGAESDIERTINTWVRDGVSGIMYEYNVTFNEFGEVVSADRSITTQSITMVGITLKTVTMRGM